MPKRGTAGYTRLQRKVNKKIKRRYPNTKRKARIVALSLVSILFTSLILSAVLIYKFVKAPFSSVANVDIDDTGRVWKSYETNILLIKVDDINDKSSRIVKLSLINFSPDTNRYAVYHIPVDVPIEYALNYGEGPLSYIYKTGNLDDDRGIYLMRKTILRLLAVDVDGYIIADNTGMAEIYEIIRDIYETDLSTALRLRNTFKIPKLIITFREIALTNLKAADIADIIKFVERTSQSSSYVMDLTKYQLLDPSKWDNLWRERLSISEVKKEAVKVFIVNASKDPKVPGLAQWGARVVLNLGGAVLETDNSFVDFLE